MRLVKVIKDLDNLDIKVHKSIGVCPNIFKDTLVNGIIRERPSINMLSSNLGFDKLTIEENKISFNGVGSHFEFSLHTHPELIPYIKCSLVDAVIGFHTSNKTGFLVDTIYHIKNRYFLRFVFNGPDELGLIWKLSL